MHKAPFHADIASAPDGAEAFWLRASDNFRIRITVWRGGGRGTVMVFPGRTEYAEKYGRVAGQLVERGFSVLVIDWRGQGLSDRYAHSPDTGYVRSFPDYQRDVAAALEARAALRLPGPLHILAHSMGGCIAHRTLVEHPDLFRAAFLSAPMWGIDLRTQLRGAVAAILHAARRLGIRGGRLPTGTSTDPDEASYKFHDNALTSDPEMFDWITRQVGAHPELGLGPARLRWVAAALLEIRRLKRQEPPSQPALVFLGTEETIVASGAVREQARAWPRASLVTLEGARHEILIETEAIRTEVWRHIDARLAEIETR